MIDFLMSRLMMILGGALLIGASVGLYDTFTAVPEHVGREQFARDWAAPILEVYRGIGQLGVDADPSTNKGVHMVFAAHVVEREVNAEGTPYRPHKRSPHFLGRGFDVLLYRDAILFEFRDGTIRVALPSVERTHLWYASNAAGYDDAAETFLDAKTAPIRLDWERPLVIRRGLDAGGAWNVYLSQFEWSVVPSSCAVSRKVITAPSLKIDETKRSCDHPKEPVFLVADGLGRPVADAEFNVESENVAWDCAGGAWTGTVTSDAAGIVRLCAPRPDENAREHRVHLFNETLATAVALPVKYTETRKT